MSPDERRQFVISILGPGLREYSLADFLKQKTVASRTVSPSPRQELSAVKVVIQSSGRTLQKGLF